MWPSRQVGSARGGLAELRIHAANGAQLGTGTFATATLRQMPGELEAARWSCAGV